MKFEDGEWYRTGAEWRVIGDTQRALAAVTTYPRWESLGPPIFQYYLDESTWVEEVMECSNSLFVAGSNVDDTLHYFGDLREALDYAEKLAFPKIQAWKFRQSKNGRRFPESITNLNEVALT